MKNLVTIKNVRGFIDENGIAQLNLEDASRGLGFITVAISGNECVRWQRVYEYLQDLNFHYDGIIKDVFIPENIFYRLAMKAKNETAEKFQILIADEILPTIRKTGTYSITVKDSYTIEDPIERARRWIEEAQERKQLADTIEEQRPKVIFADAVSVSNRDILIRELAKILYQNEIEIGERRLFQWLRDHEYLEKRRNFSTQKVMELELFKVQETAITHSNGLVTTSFTPKITPKGQYYFINKFLENQEKVI